MSQQRKIPVEEMIRIVELYLSGKIGFTSAYQEAGVSDEAFRKWLSQLFWIIWQEKDRNGRFVRDTESGIKGNLSIG